MSVSSHSNTLTWQDDAGALWSPSSEYKRWVVLGPHLVDMLETIGAAELIVGVHDDHDSPGRRTKSIAGYPVVGQPGQVNQEYLRRVRPDLIVYWPAGMSMQQVQRVQQLGIPVLTISPKGLDDIPERLRWLGRLTNRTQAAELLADQLVQDLRQQRQLYAQGARLRGLYQISQTPLYSLAPDHLVSQAMRLCGVDTIVPASAVAAPVLSVEAVLRAEPQIILVSTQVHSSAQQFWSRFSRLPAMQSGAILSVNDKALTRPGLSLLAAIPELCQQLRPWRELASPASR